MIFSDFLIYFYLSYSLIRIHISNEGPNSIPDYGDIIIVERRITHKISTVTIKTRLNEGKEEIVGKRRELDLILQQFNIDLENPLSWLSQDRARQFLQSMKPQRLYEVKNFFLFFASLCFWGFKVIFWVS